MPVLRSAWPLLLWVGRRVWFMFWSMLLIGENNRRERASSRGKEPCPSVGLTLAEPTCQHFQACGRISAILVFNGVKQLYSKVLKRTEETKVCNGSIFNPYLIILLKVFLMRDLSFLLHWTPSLDFAGMISLTKSFTRVKNSGMCDLHLWSSQQVMLSHRDALKKKKAFNKVLFYAVMPWNELSI